MLRNVFLVILNYWIISSVAAAGELDKDVEIISGKDVPQTNPLDARFVGHSLYANDLYGPRPEPPEPEWKGWAMLVAGEGGGRLGEVSFRQMSPVNPILVTINVTGIMPGKHAVHVHAFGDMRDGCRSTGPHLRGIMIGNIDVPESGNLDLSFYSQYIQLFGIRGVVGRAIVIHEKPIAFTQSPDIYGIPVANQAIQPVSYQTEEMAVGGTVACGIITIVDNRQQPS